MAVYCWKEIHRVVVLKKIANFTKDLLQYDPELIIVSRENFDRLDTTKNYIVIDGLPSRPIGNFSRYDGETEIQTLTTRFLGDFQILFYGIDALHNALLWQNMLNSENAFTLQSALGINIYRTTSHNNLRIEDGSNFDNLYQCDFKVKYDESVDINTLRIDTAVISVTNSGEVIDIPMVEN